MATIVDDPISRWWTAFAQQAPQIDRLFRGHEEWDLPEWMQEHLGAIHPDLMWEFGPAVKTEGHRLVITPESRRELRPLAREVLRRAPALAGWEFYEYRLPESLEDAALTVEGRAGGDIRELRVQVRPGDFNLVDLTYLGFSAADEEERKSAMAFVATESLLGEETLNRWIGGIDTAAKPAEGAQPIHVAELRQELERTIEQLRAGLPDRPWHRVEITDETEWSILEVTSEEAEDYPEQSDLLTAVTLVPTIVTNAVSHAPFDSARYSKFAETFCYLKIDHGEKHSASLVDDRTQFEDAISAALRPAGLGAVVGGGTGRRYIYIELALCDVDRAWTETRLVLQDARLPTRTWLLFHDDDLRAEWRGLYDDTPEPPMAAEDMEE